jgi:dolichol-phosphate mannosyltransferase
VTTHEPTGSPADEAGLGDRSDAPRRALVVVVVPAFNEADNVVAFHASLSRVFADPALACDAEFLFVDDGSTDRTLPALREIASRDPRVRVVALSRNFGHQAALTAGMDRARGDAVITMDCDFQDPPEVIPLLVAKWREGNKVVYARRAIRADGFVKRATADVYYRLLAASLDVVIPRNVGDFRLLDRDVLRNLLRLEEHARYLRGMVAWLGYRHDFVDFERPDRIAGKTGYTVAKMVRLAMDGLMNFSVLPLRIGLWTGIASMAMSFMALVYMACDAIHNHADYPLYKWLVVVLFGFTGAQFVFVWLVGEYVARIYNDVRKRPIYIVADEPAPGRRAGD